MREVLDEAVMGICLTASSGSPFLPAVALRGGVQW